MWWISSSPESFRLLEWQAENNASGQGSSTESSPVVFLFFEPLFLDAPGRATGNIRTCGLRRNSSSLDKAPKMPDSVRLNSLERFSLTLSSISPEAWEIYSWSIRGSSVFCAWLLFVFSSVSLETAAIFLLIFNVALIVREKLCQFWRLNWFLKLNQMWQSPLLWG